MVGYSKEVLFDHRRQYWLWTPILGPIFGGLAGTCVYDFFLFIGSESVVNKPNTAAKLHYEQDNVTEGGHVATTV
jgi:aquaglyceroporin related protein